jgi:hypothetical protein
LLPLELLLLELIPLISGIFGPPKVVNRRA